MLERCSTWLVVNIQVKACSRETHSLSRASKISGHKAFQITHLHATVINNGRATLLNTAHTVGCTVELASVLTVATILADATVTPTVSEMSYNVSSGTLNHTQPTNFEFKIVVVTCIVDDDDDDDDDERQTCTGQTDGQTYCNT